MPIIVNAHDSQVPSKVVINSISDAVNFMEGDEDTFYSDYVAGLKGYMSDYIEKYDDMNLVVAGEIQDKGDLTKEEGLAVQFTDEFMQNKDMVTALENIFPIYQNMKKQLVDEMTEGQEIEHVLLSDLNTSTQNASIKADGLVNEKNRGEKHFVFPMSSVVIGGGFVWDLMVNKSTSLIEKIQYAFDSDTGDGVGLLAGASVAIISVVSGFCISKTVSKIAYDSKIKEVRENLDDLAKQWEENKEKYQKLEGFSKVITAQHAENQEILETKARAELLQNAFYQSPYALKHGLNG